MEVVVPPELGPAEGLSPVMTGVPLAARARRRPAPHRPVVQVLPEGKAPAVDCRMLRMSLGVRLGSADSRRAETPAT
jgi:hypothetical protein